MALAAIIISVVGICANVFLFLLQFGIISIRTKANDPYKDYRNEKGLFTPRSKRVKDDE
jgi:hypothetical protein